MGDSYQSLVAVDVELGDAAELANLAVSSLISKGILIPKEIETNWGNPFLGEVRLVKETVYTPGPSALDVVIDRVRDSGFLTLLTNHVEVIAGRNTYHHFDELSSVNCPNCNAELRDEVYEQQRNWTKTGNTEFACNQCAHVMSITSITGDPPIVLGCLGLRFWNWPPFNDQFMEDLTSQLGSIEVVWGRI